MTFPWQHFLESLLQNTFLSYLFCWRFYVVLFHLSNLENKDTLTFYPTIERVLRKKGSNFSIICTTQRMRYYSRNFNWFKENGILPNTTNIVRQSTFLRLDFPNLKVEDTGIYKCNVTDDPNLEYKRFQMIVFGKCFHISWWIFVTMVISSIVKASSCTARKIKFSIDDFFSKCDQIFRKLWIWSHWLKKFWM